MTRLIISIMSNVMNKSFFFWYIRDLSRYLRSYLQHCSQYKTYQIKKHVSYEFFQFILISSMSFHTITLNFILILSKTSNEFDTIMSVFCKYFKKIIIVFEKSTWTTSQWKEILLNKLNIVDWEILKIIIFDKDRKFLNDMWIVIFKKFDVRFLYFIVYYFQTNKQSEKTNQTIEIVFRFHLIIMKKFIDWLLMFFKIQRHFNNVFFTIIFKTFNEIAYDFTSVQSFDL